MSRLIAICHQSRSRPPNRRGIHTSRAASERMGSHIYETWSRPQSQKTESYPTLSTSTFPLESLLPEIILEVISQVALTDASTNALTPGSNDLLNLALTSSSLHAKCLPFIYRHVNLTWHSGALLEDVPRNANSSTTLSDWNFGQRLEEFFTASSSASTAGKKPSYVALERLLMFYHHGVDELTKRQTRFIETMLSKPEYGRHVRTFAWTQSNQTWQSPGRQEKNLWAVFGALTEARRVHFAYAFGLDFELFTPPIVFPVARRVQFVGNGADLFSGKLLGAFMMGQRKGFLGLDFSALAVREVECREVPVAGKLNHVVVLDFLLTRSGGAAQDDGGGGTPKKKCLQERFPPRVLMNHLERLGEDGERLPLDVETIRHMWEYRPLQIDVEVLRGDEEVMRIQVAGIP